MAHPRIRRPLFEATCDHMDPNDQPIHRFRRFSSFLNGRSTTGPPPSFIPQPEPKRRRISNRNLFIGLIIQSLALAWVAFELSVRRGQWDRDRITYRALFSPAQDAVEYVIKNFEPSASFQRPPSDELDADWEALYNFGISRVPKSQAALLANKTEPIAGDDGYYIVELDVFHQIHCLNIVRKALYPHHYTTMHLGNKHNNEHANHCVDNIRQSLMCASDVSPVVWQWDESRKRSVKRGDVAHTCRNFDKIREWALDRTLQGPHNDSIHTLDDIVIPVYQSDSLQKGMQ